MDKNIRELFVEMTSLYTAMNELKREEGGEIRAMAKSQEDLLPRIVKETKECCEFIEKYASHPFGQYSPSLSPFIFSRTVVLQHLVLHGSPYLPTASVSRTTVVRFTS